MPLILHELAANKSMLNEVYLLYVSADYLLERQTDFCILVRVSAQPLQSYLTLCNPIYHSVPGSSVHGDSPGKNTGVGCHALLQGIFLTQGWNPHLLCLLHRQAGSLLLVPPSITFTLQVGKLRHREVKEMT